MARFNPMRQVPALATPSGELLTESAAILTWLAERHPEGRLAPGAGYPARGQFLRRMSFVSAAIYALYWLRDDPSRLVGDDEDLHQRVDASTKDRIADCWGIMDRQVRPAPYILGPDLTVLDIYVAVVSRWWPGRSRFYAEAPGLADVVRRVDAEPRLRDLWAERFSFEEGWER